MTNPFHEPAESGDSDDAVWEDLVRRLEADPAAAPEAPDAPPGDSPGPDAPGTVLPGANTPPAVDPQLFRMHPALTGPRDYEASEDDDDGAFIPEEPPALGSGNPLLTLAWTCAAGAPMALLLLAIFWRRAPMPLWIGLVVIAVAAAVFLFARLPRHRQDDDDGARV
ncbi:hypothetical protein [Paeniglutamicibacter psychrophenolicus]|uniref:hypothetical protein n=1 Tax=Paeniglutamicibacter psychrophenolicus TaxID=257454 RepID=UPI00277E36FF|nr:hypothetical protein [Paeniglutamicibacter psychrophenolicus]MDQ0095361.1 hypothetical protein [Paeniglutamicibacter psychrophenolicus]